ncbi:integral membrane protein S linking to the trans Golgi network-domain-containing protein [Tuber brumale]|nr:integral membrane protein S linking to the trans Golgi network-domain-containing protein [Tuber brumale]
MPKRPRRLRRPSPDSFQPLKTLLQILSLQTIYYISSSVLILFTALVAGCAFSLDLIFSWRSVRGDNTVGWTLSIVWLLCSGIMVIAQVLVHARSKMVLDFSLTLHFLHLLVVSGYEWEVPKSVLWWGLQIASAALMVGVGTWACRWRELRPIPFGNGGGGSGGVGGGTVGAGDSGGAYEMVRMKEEEV